MMCVVMTCWHSYNGSIAGLDAAIRGQENGARLWTELSHGRLDTRVLPFAIALFVSNVRAAVHGRCAAALEQLVMIQTELYIRC